MNHCATLNFENDLPRDAAKNFCTFLGEASSSSKNSITWSGNDIPTKLRSHAFKIEIMDEEIPHTWPVDHIDFVYSTRSYKKPDGSCDMTPEHAYTIATATGSVFLDLLKCEATARCHYLIKNDVSLHFVHEVMYGGEITSENAKNKYKDAILSNHTTQGYTDPFNEREKTMGEGMHHVGPGDDHHGEPQKKCPLGSHRHPGHQKADPRTGCMQDTDM
jgi:hypothetical protein